MNAGVSLLVQSSIVTRAMTMLAAACAMSCATRAEPTAQASREIATQVSHGPERCATCHEAIVREWNASLHRASHDDVDYRQALAGEPIAFCNSCHAPSRVAAHGVSCETCHERAHRDGVDVKVSAAASRPTTTRACASCHEFTFPSGRGAMQKTVAEHRASTHARESCESCHMPLVGTGAAKHRHHGFAASRDEEMLRRALEVTASMRGPGTVEVALRVTGAGHAVPTGDMFRRLRVTAEAIDERGVVASRDERTLARRFDHGPSGYVEIADERPGGSSGDVVRVPLDLGEPAMGKRIRYRVDHERVTNGFRAQERAIASITLAEGELHP